MNCSQGRTLKENPELGKASRGGAHVVVQHLDQTCVDKNSGRDGILQFKAYPLVTPP